MVSRLTAFGGFLKYTVSYEVPVEAVDGDPCLMPAVIIKVTAFPVTMLEPELWGQFYD